eukprot:COSAG03_NODE_10900_length_623_cov_0.742366_2_plen_37_part_01
MDELGRMGTNMYWFLRCIGIQYYSSTMYLRTANGSEH